MIVGVLARGAWLLVGSRVHETVPAISNWVTYLSSSVVFCHWLRYVQLKLEERGERQSRGSGRDVESIYREQFDFAAEQLYLGSKVRGTESGPCTEL